MRSFRVCDQCGLPHDRQTPCIAREEERKRVGYRPGFRASTSHFSTANEGQKYEALPVQTGPQRG